MIKFKIPFDLGGKPAIQRCARHDNNDHNNCSNNTNSDDDNCNGCENSNNTNMTATIITNNDNASNNYDDDDGKNFNINSVNNSDYITCI
jgi:hypothetical protein